MYNAILLVACAASLLVNVLVIVSFFAIKPIRGHPSGLIVLRGVFDSILCIMFATSVSSEHFCMDDSVSAVGHLVAFFTETAFIGSELCYLCLCFDLRRCVSNPFVDNKVAMKQYIYVSVAISVLFGIAVGAISQVAGPSVLKVCWIKERGNGKINIATQLLFYVPVAIIYSFSMIFLIVGSFRLTRGLSKSQNVRRDASKRARAHAIAFSVYWVCFIALYIALFVMSSNNGQDNGPVVAVLEAFVPGARGIIVAIPWFSLYGKTIMDVLKKRLVNKSITHTGETLIAALRQEILVYTRSGIRTSLQYAAAQAKRASEEHVERNVFVQSAASRRDSVVGMPMVDLSKGSVDLELGVSRGGGEQPLGDVEYVLYDENKPQQQQSMFDRVLIGPQVRFVDFHPPIFRRIRRLFEINDDEYIAALAHLQEKISEGKSGAFMYFSQGNHYIIKTTTTEECKFLLRLLPAYEDYVSRNKHTLIVKVCGAHALEIYGRQLSFIVMTNIFSQVPRIHDCYDLKGSWIARHSPENTKAGKSASCRHCFQKFKIGDGSMCSELPHRPHEASRVMKDLDLHHKIILRPQQAEAIRIQAKRDAHFLSTHNIMDYSLLVGVVREEFRHPHLLSFPPDSSSSSSSFMASPFSSLSPPPEATAKANSDKSSLLEKKKHTIDTSQSPNDTLSGADGEIPEFREADGGLTAPVVKGPGAFYMGIIDILQQWTIEKRLERFFKGVRLGSFDGMSSVSPPEYSERFSLRVIDAFIVEDRSWLASNPRSPMPLVSLRGSNNNNNKNEEIDGDEDRGRANGNDKKNNESKESESERISAATTSPHSNSRIEVNHADEENDEQKQQQKQEETQENLLVSRGGGGGGGERVDVKSDEGEEEKGEGELNISSPPYPDVDGAAADVEEAGGRESAGDLADEEVLLGEDSGTA